MGYEGIKDTRVRQQGCPGMILASICRQDKKILYKYIQYSRSFNDLANKFVQMCTKKPGDLVQQLIDNC